MSGSKPTDSERALARLLADALRQPAGAQSDSACPDAELLAAYAEQGLDAAETAHWESHFSECARCQKILAVLTVSEEPLTDAEVERFGRKLATLELKTPSQAQGGSIKKAASFERPRTAWRWLAPAAGIAAAAALWFALRPAPRPYSAANTAEKTATEPAPPPDDSLEAKANVPAPPAATEREAEQRQLAAPNVAREFKKESSQEQKTKPVPAPPAPEANPAEAAAEVQPILQAQNQAAEVPTRAKQSEDAAAAAAAPPAEPSAASPSAPAASTDAATRTVARTPAAVPPPSAAANGETPQAKTAPNRTVQLFAARQAVGGVPAAGSLGRTLNISAPSGNAMWRFGAGGQIEHSNDRGKSWQPQASSVTGELLAGSAPSDLVAWVVGRAGVILRTTDGERWQRVGSPAATTDWTAIEATDALNATITSSDRRRFVTDDAGQTWKQLTN
jgi:hypothetical protein